MTTTGQPATRRPWWAPWRKLAAPAPPSQKPYVYDPDAHTIGPGDPSWSMMERVLRGEAVIGTYNADTGEVRDATFYGPDGEVAEKYRNPDA